MLLEMDDILTKDQIEVLETNVDDVTGEVLGNLFDNKRDTQTIYITKRFYLK
jgi:uncharacterized protein (DUF111 family)